MAGRWRNLGYGAILPFSDERERERVQMIRDGIPGKPVDLTSSMFRSLREESHIPDRDLLEVVVTHLKVETTYEYSRENIEMLRRHQRRRLPPSVRRNLIRYPKTDYQTRYNSGPPLAPPPKIPSPYDDLVEWGFKEKYLYRLKPIPKEKPKEKGRKRKASAHATEETIEQGTGSNKRARTAADQESDAASVAAVQSTAEHATCDIPIPSVEGIPEGDEEMMAIASNMQKVARWSKNVARHGPPSPPPTDANISRESSPAPMALALPAVTTTLPTAPCTPTSVSTIDASSSFKEGPRPPSFEKDGFLAFPLEVRFQIYRCLLLHHKPIRVHAS